MRIPTSLTVPGHRRNVLIRRVLAAVLVIAAALSALTSARDHPTALVAAREIPAGHELQAEDITTARVPTEMLPSASLGSDPAEAVGRVSVAAIGKGEILSSSRVLSTELVADLVGGGESHMIPVKLAEPDILPHLHHGDTVNVIAGNGEPTMAMGSRPDAENPTPPSHTTIASGARVVAVGAPEEEARPDTVLLALAADSAEIVAAASLSQPLTVVIVGDRAHPHTDSSPSRD
ncbi:SAF domain-containing protein [Corynebacterium sp.]|uniref:SAF domain-containing protein n=1 Tax=Corynebacterium sp. TaxID=1720 RepID=UPI0026DD33DB|nr:SAF domain-containing protein [Corynebacterium sp.]MDO5033038.1 SAF domain-containing protein [Corynebacterium sp.]